MAGTTARYKRYAEIVAVGARHDLGFVFDHLGLGRFLSPGDAARREGPRTYAERVRACLEDLGPTFVKLGQIMSTRPDLVPRDYLVELKKLQDHVQPIPFDEVRRTVEEELGGTLADKYGAFDEEPIAAASIGQVHRATLPGGKPVAVKVQRPGIEETIKLDISILYDMARLAKSVSSLADFADPVLMVREFERTILREVDFMAEAHLNDEFRANLERFPDVRVAEVEWDHTTRRVLTMELFEGIKVSDIEAIEQRGHDRRKLAALIGKVTLHTIFHDGLFHADPHPGNLLVLDDGKLAIIDFGMVGRFDRQTMQMLRDLALHMSQLDYDALARALLKHGVVDYDVDLRKLARRMRELFRSLTGGNVSMAKQSEALVQFLVDERLYYQPDLVLLDKTFGTLEGSMRTLSPDLDMGALFAEFAPELGASLLGPKEMATELVTRLWQMDDVLLDLPPILHRVLGRLDAGKLVVRVERRLGREGLGELASLVMAGALCAGGLLGLGGAVVVRGATANGTLLGLPFWPMLLGSLGGATFVGGLYRLWRLQS